ncbi:low density lipoprotein receptor adapter protein 1 [Leptonychotes weddellii]|uniref:Low density lipoprotein receptor adapter protein 1 n=1 Tax=Leptonychotes weddellii TaxID=9713 RepID=A0A7F8R386_LEPWE|nr:low density lipoprotein receptor adapter protein 1 [Leptonychotes weddellii]
MDALKSAGRALIRSPSLAKQSWGGGGRHRRCGPICLERAWPCYTTRLLGDQGGARTLPSPTCQFGALVERSLGPAFQTCCYLPDRLPPPPFPVFQAQAVTLTVAQAFKVAFEFWQVSKEEKEKRDKASQEGGDVLGGGLRDSTPSLKSLVATGNLLDLEETAKAPLSTVSANTTNMDEAPRPQALNNSSVVWELDDGLDEAFSRLAQSRTNPQVLDTGLTAQDIHYAQCHSPVDWDKPDGSGAEQDDLFSF